MRGHEDSIISRVDRGRERESAIINKAYERADKILKEATPSPQSFANLYSKDDIAPLYSKDEIAHDLAYVEDRKRRFEKVCAENPSLEITDKMSRILEAIMYEHTELSNWFGKDAKTYKTADFDDIANGVDLVTEFGGEAGTPAHLALGIDVTFTTRHQEKKFDRIWDSIMSQKLSAVKYFQSEDSGKRRLSGVPGVVIGIEKGRLEEIVSLWMQNKKKELGNHPVRALLIEEIYEQLKRFRDVAEVFHKDSAFKAYERAFKTIQKIRGAQKPDLGELKNDAVYQAMMKELDKFKVGGG